MESRLDGAARDMIARTLTHQTIAAHPQLDVSETSEPVQCAHCGNHFMDNAVFCRKCGNSRNVEADPEPEAEDAWEDCATPVRLLPPVSFASSGSCAVLCCAVPCRAAPCCPSQPRLRTPVSRTPCNILCCLCCLSVC